MAAGDFITALAVFVTVLVPLLSFMSMRERRRNLPLMDRESLPQRRPAASASK
jgi:hypothetical protein